MTRIDLNADLGEGVADDPGLLAVVTSANVACGYHAGDATTMEAVCVVPRGEPGALLDATAPVRWPPRTPSGTRWRPTGSTYDLC